MKLVELENVSLGEVRIVPVRGLNLMPGESKKVHPATVMHPAVSPYIPHILRVKSDGGVVLVEPVGDKKKEEPIAPVTSVSDNTGVAPNHTEKVTEVKKTEVETPEVIELEVTAFVEKEPVVSVVEPNADEKTQTVESDETPGDLREVYLSAPGITDANVNAVLATYPDISSLAASSKDELTALGVSKNQTKRVLTWAKSQV